MDPRFREDDNVVGIRRSRLLLVDQHILLPLARGFVRPVDTADPATRPFLAFEQLLTGALDAALTGFRLFGIIHPADEFIATERCQFLPKIKQRRVGFDSTAQIILRLMHRSVWKAIGHVPK
jgi:hypothetical protein